MPVPRAIARITPDRRADELNRRDTSSQAVQIETTTGRPTSAMPMAPIDGSASREAINTAAVSAKNAHTRSVRGTRPLVSHQIKNASTTSSEMPMVDRNVVEMAQSSRVTSTVKAQ